MESALFEGFVSHSRSTPIKHQFQYPTFMVLLDLDNLESFFERSVFWSLERWNWASFYRSDFLNPKEPDLKIAVAKTIYDQHNEHFNGKVFLLTHVRYLGYCFNPVSFYLCIENDQMAYIVAEINNTPWNERFSYVMKCESAQHWHEFDLQKQFHVSPFNPMDMQYHWCFHVSADCIQVKMRNLSQGTKHFQANLNLKHVPATGKNLAKMLFKFPAETIKTVVAIYWQALKLKYKGATFYDHPNSNEDIKYGNLRD